LVLAIQFTRRFGKVQTLQQTLGILLQQLIDDSASGKGFEVGDV